MVSIGFCSVGKLGNSSYEHPIEFSGHEMKSRNVLTHKDLISFAYQVARGMEYLESRKVTSTSLLLPCPTPSSPCLSQKKKKKVTKSTMISQPDGLGRFLCPTQKPFGRHWRIQFHLASTATHFPTFAVCGLQFQNPLDVFIDAVYCIRVPFLYCR